MPTLNPTIHKLLKKLEEDGNILGIILFGSWARGENREGSDVDLIVIQKAGFKRAVETLGSQVFEIVYTTSEDALKYWKQNLDNAANLWEHGQILFDQDGSLKEMKKEIEKVLLKGKPNLSADQIGQLRFDAEDQISYSEYIENYDHLTAQIVLNNKIINLTAVYFDLRVQWTPPLKSRMKKLREVDNQVYGLLNEFFKENDFDNKLRLGHNIVKHVFA